jgi:hypothetical protein
MMSSQVKQSLLHALRRNGDDFQTRLSRNLHRELASCRRASPYERGLLATGDRGEHGQFEPLPQSHRSSQTSHA